MINSEIIIQVIEVPYYFLKLFLRKISKSRVNPINISYFENYENIDEFFYRSRDIKTYKSEFEVFDELQFFKLSSISLKHIEKTSVKYYYGKYLEIINREGLPVDEKKNIILDGYYKRPFRNGRLKKTGLFSVKYHANVMLGSLFKPVRKYRLQNALIITSRWSENYYHWMTEIIARLSLVDKVNHNIDTIVINHMVNQFQKDTIRFLNLNKKIVETKRNHFFEVENGIIPQLENIDSYRVFYLRKVFKNLMVKDATQYVYISRVNSKSRKIINETEFDNVLKRLGIKNIRLEFENFEQQVRLIHNAKLIISPHGAGLTNLIFAQPGTKVIEFIPEKRFSKHFIKISSILNLTHIIIRYKGDSKHNFKVNVEKFESFIRKFIDKPL